MSKEEWNTILDTEEGQKTAILVVEQVLEKVSRVIFEKRIQNQLIPYTLNYVKSVSLEIWRFLAKDNGEWDNYTWEMDIEPDWIQPDSWARGILKVSKEIPAQEIENIPLIANKQWKSSTAELVVPATKTKVTINNTVVTKKEKSKEVVEPVKKLSTDQIIKQENKKLLDRIRHMEKDGSIANYTYDHDGRIILLRKSAPPKAFNPHVTVNVVDEKEKTVKNTLPFRRETKGNQNIKKQVTMVNINENLGFIPDEGLEIPILADVIKVAPGVVFKEGGSVRVGGEFIPKVQEVLQPHPPKDAPISQNDEVLAKILEKARPFVKS